MLRILTTTTAMFLALPALAQTESGYAEETNGPPVMISPESQVPQEDADIYNAPSEDTLNEVPLVDESPVETTILPEQADDMENENMPPDDMMMDAPVSAPDEILNGSEPESNIDISPLPEMEPADDGAQDGVEDAYPQDTVAPTFSAPETVPDETIPVPEPVLPPVPVEEPPAEPVHNLDPLQPDEPQIPAAALSSEATGQVTETVVNEGQSRSSDEDFMTRANRDSGLSNDAKNVLFGLGGFALGHVLSDRSRVEMNTGDRIIVTNPQGEARVVKNDDAMLVMPGHEVRTETFDDGSSRSIITRPDGSQVITIRGADLSVLSRRVITADGRETVIVDQTRPAPRVDVRSLPEPTTRTPVYSRDEDALRRALTAATQTDRNFSLQQVLTIKEVRDLAVPVGVNTITFQTGSAAITPDQARSLLALGNVIRDMIARNPAEVFLIEGHTDSVGNDLTNLALSDRRAESLAKALSEHFGVPPENLVVQGYGERYLLIPQEGDVWENRRAAVRRITPLIHGW